ncbi:MAG: insulinase family protein [Alphaproteobacteria bacterium]|nr:insulinase family protein [Alphaproteobacteria bacterium]
MTLISTYRYGTMLGLCVAILTLGAPQMTVAADGIALPPKVAAKASGGVSTARNLNNVREVSGKSGLTAWYVEEHALPIVSVRIAIKGGGAAYDPAGKEGLANVVASMLDEGAGSYDSQAFQKELEKKAIQMSFDIDNDYLFIEMKMLKENADRAFELLSLALTKPRLDTGDMARVRKQIITAITKSEEDPNYVGEKALNETLFGKHPYAHPSIGNRKSVEAVGTGDVKTYISQKITRNQMVVTMVGDVSADTIANWMDKYLGVLPDQAKTNGKALPDKVAEVTQLNYRTQTVSRPIPQSVIMFAGKGVKRKDPDFYAAYVLNYILGGGSFESKLMKELREKRGLVYSAYTYLENYKYASLLRGGAATQSKNVDQALRVIKDVVQDASNNITEQDVADAKRYLIGSFPLQLDTNDKLALFLTIMQLDNLGKDFLQQRNESVAKVTAQDVKRVAKSLLSVDKLSFVVVGK